jgi:hypothetical protein
VTSGRAIELLIAVALFVAGLIFYRRRDKADSYGSQGAVILFVVAVIVAIHALGLMEYHPSPAEADMIQEQGQ